MTRTSKRLRIAWSLGLGAMLLGTSVLTTAAARPIVPPGCTLSNGVKASGNATDGYVITGTRKADTINCSGATAIVIVAGGAGDDTITGGTAADGIVGDAGNDALAGGPGPDSIQGSDGNDGIDGGPGSETIDGGPGNDTILGGDGGDQIVPRAGDDTVSGGAGDDVIIDGDQGGNDTFSGDDGDDLLDGVAGDDTLHGGLGNDTLSSSAGTDAINGGGGVDTLSFENATQGVNASVAGSLFGGDGYGTSANETYAGIENLFGGAFQDQLTGDASANDLRGGDSSDNLFGGDGGDTLNGGLGNDGVFGEDGDDLLFGSNGNDLIAGGPGNDLLNGGPHDATGGDDCQGGIGTNTYVDCETVSEPAADLVVADLRIGAAAFQPDTYGPVEIRLKNQGGTAVTSGIKISLHVSNDGGATYSAAQSTNTLDDDIPAGATTDWLTVNSTWNVCCSGGSTGSWLVAVVDPDNTIPETDDTNNEYALVLYPPPPDLIITGVALTGASWGGGGTDPEYAYRVTVKNQGGSAAQSSQAGFGIAGQGYYSEDTTIDGNDGGACGSSFNPSTTIAPGDSLELYIGCSGGPQASHDYLLVEIDIGNFVAEGSETNNLFTKTLP